MAIIFILVTNFITPRNFNPLVPTHSDYFVCYTYAQTSWSFHDLLLPRPLFWIYLQVIGVFHEPSYFYLAMAIPAFIFIYLSFRLLDKFLNFSNRKTAQVIFYLASFSSAYFVQMFQLDVSGTLAGVFSMTSLLALHHYWTQDSNQKIYASISLIFFFLALETKPNLTFLILIAYILVNYLKPIKISFFISGVAFALSILVYISDKMRGSVWVQSSDSGSPYAVIIDPIKNLKLIAYYVAKSMNWPMALLALLSVLVLVYFKKWKTLLMFSISIPASLGTLSLLVNRPWEMYAWYPRLLFAALLLFSFEHFSVWIRQANLRHSERFTISITILITLALVFDGNFGTKQRDWFHYIYDYNRNIIQSLELMESENKTLIAGVSGPYHPFKDTKYIEIVYPNVTDVDLLLKKSEKSWNDISPQLTNGVYFENLDLSKYSRIYLLDRTGKIVSFISKLSLNRFPAHVQEEILQCVENFDVEKSGYISRSEGGQYECSF